MKLRSFWNLPSAAAGVILGALAMASPALAAGAPVDINVILSLSGGGAFLGTGEQATLQILEKQVNADGGIQGRPVHFTISDDQTSPQAAVQLASQLFASHPPVVLGSNLVALCNAMAPLTEPKGPLLYCFSPGIHPKLGSFAYTSNVSTRDFAAVFVRFLRMKGLTKVALITSTDASGQDAAQAVRDALKMDENKGMTLVARAEFNPTDVSVSAQIETIKAANPQALIAWSTGSPIGTVFKAIVQSGLDVPVVTTNGNMTYAQMSQYASFLPKVLYIPSSQWPETAAGEQLPPEVAKAHEKFHGAFKAAGKQPDFTSALAWDPTMVVIDALRKLGPDVPAEQLRDYLSKLKGYAGINGFYDFTKVPQRGLGEDACVVTVWAPAKNTWAIVSKPGGAPLASAAQ